MKPNFEAPAHTARDLVERNITLYLGPYAQFYKQWLSQHAIPEYNKIAETMVIAKSYDHYDEMTKNELLIHGTHTHLSSYVGPWEQAWATEYDHDQGRYKRNFGRGFYRGELLFGDNPMTGYLTNKKWRFNEVTLNWRIVSIIN